jgi:hypothetical protein
MIILAKVPGLPRRRRLGELFVLLFLSSLIIASASAAAPPGAPDPRWKNVRLSGATDFLPIRMVAYDEPWEAVVQDVQERLATRVTGRSPRVGFYGHGAFVAATEVQHDVLFVAGLGVAAAMDVMIFPQWRFPETNPLRDIPRQILREQLQIPWQNPGATVMQVTKSKVRQLARENRYATAHAAVRLAHGIHAFHRHRLTPALAAFSNSAIVLVRLGELLEQGSVADGHTGLVVADDVRQGVAMTNLVIFGYPLPHGAVAMALRRRVQGALVNVVPAQCWQQLAGNFLLRGGVENVLVSWGPTHNGWPQLAPQGPEVAVLGAFLGGRSTAWGELLTTRATAGISQFFSWAKLLPDTLCEYLLEFDPDTAFGRP